MVITVQRQGQQLLAGLHPDFNDLQRLDDIGRRDRGSAKYIHRAHLTDLQSDQRGGSAGRQAFARRTDTTVGRDVAPGTGCFQRHIEPYRWRQQFNFRCVTRDTQGAGQ
ncbi:hypothetical protein D3C76_1270530 [compost metagenome]